MKGLLHSIEAVIAVTIIITVAIVFFRSLPTPQLSELSYKLSGFNALEILEKGKLREYVLDEDVASIENKLAPHLSTLNYKVVIYNKTSNITSIPTIESKDVITISYLLAGDVGNYSAREVRLYIWGFE